MKTEPGREYKSLATEIYITCRWGAIGDDGGFSEGRATLGDAANMVSRGGGVASDNCVAPRREGHQTTCRENKGGSTAACVCGEPVRLVVAARGIEPALAASVWRQGLVTK